VRARLILATLATTVVAGCSGPSTPAPQTPPSTPPTASAAALPPRPVELPLNTVDPCTLLTPTQRAKLGLSAGIGDTNTDELGSPACLWNTTTRHPDDSWIAKTITNRSADYALGSTTPATVVTIAGLPAVQTATAYGNPNHECLLFIDVAQGQSLQVEYLNQRGDHPGITHEIACQLATIAATDMITTLRTATK
jgi:hypothetical protein